MFEEVLWVIKSTQKKSQRNCSKLHVYTYSGFTVTDYNTIKKRSNILLWSYSTIKICLHVQENITGNWLNYE